jgi:uncharacterized repeat protein (TIGR03847 family)
MPEFVYDLDPASFITVGTVGPPGRRTFYLQASEASTLVSLVIEKEQASALAQSLDRLLEALKERYPSRPDPIEEVAYDMELLQPLTDLWRVGQMGLGYDEEVDRIVLIAQELQVEDDEEIMSEPEAVRMTATREQMQALSEHAVQVVEQGRPECPLCGNPIDSSGHFCPPRNGHRRQALV